MTMPTPPAEAPRQGAPLDLPAAPAPAVPPFDPRPVTQWPALPAKPKGSRKHLFFGAGGLAVGLVAGLLLAAAGGAVGGAVQKASSASSGIADSVKACSAEGVDGVKVMDNGQSLDLKTTGKESTGTSIVTVVCVLNELGAPESLFARLDSTRALDGTREADWEGYTASWTYHPDNGLNIIVQAAQ